MVLRCGGVKSQEELDNEKKILELNKFKSRVEKMSYSRKETQLEKQIALAEKQEDTLSDYEMMRLDNMRERQTVLEQLDIHKEKKAIAEHNKKLAIFTPKDRIKQREPSKRIRLKNESMAVSSKTDGVCSLSQTSRMSPVWVGQWLPLKVFPTTRYSWNILARNIQEGKVHPRFCTPDQALGEGFSDIYDLYELDLACHVPTVDMAVSEVLELKKDLHTSLATLDCLAAECKHVKYEPRYIESTASPLEGLVQTQDSIIVSAPISCLDTCWDMIAHGSTMGQVGIQIESTVLNWRPHHRSVTRVLLSGGSDNLSLLSSSMDGSVRRTDLARQLVLVEHHGLYGVSSMEKYQEDSFLLNLGQEVSMMDLRTGKVCKVLDLSETENSGDKSSLAVNPTNNNIVSVCLDSSVRIYDLRNSSQVLNFLPGSFSQSQWSPHSGKQFLTVKKKGLSEIDPYNRKHSLTVKRESCYIVDVYCSSDLNTPTLSKKIDENQSPVGIQWNPWHESSLLLSEPYSAVRR